MRLSDRSAIVTGATRGIGKQIALSFAEEGADVIINGNDRDELRQVRKMIRALGRRCELVVGDISDPQTSDNLAERCIGMTGKLDILVNNASVNSRIPFLELSAAEWRQMLDINLDGVFYACKVSLPYMVKQGSGSIVNISSTAGKTAHPNATASYGVSKAGVNSLTQKLAFEMAPYGIRVNALCPGPVETDMSLQWSDDYRRGVTGKIPLGRLGRPEDVAAPAVFLASDDAAFITGETINVNGGNYMN